MTLRRRVLLSFSFVALATGGAVFAADSGNFSRLDKDGDGFIGHGGAAADADAKSRFHALDKNNDQKISREEYAASKDGAASASAGDTKSAVPSDGGAFSTATPTTGKTSTDPSLENK